MEYDDVVAYMQDFDLTKSQCRRIINWMIERDWIYEEEEADPGINVWLHVKLDEEGRPVRWGS